MDFLGKYRLERELGRGGMGVVYLATDTTLTREVALKVIHPSLLSDEQFVVRFEREARAVALLSHPNIAHVNAFVNEGGILGIEMPYLSGGSLREQFAVGLPPSRLIAYLVQVLRALEYCHGMDVVHRDVKPSNVLLDERGQAKLSDFGLAKLLSESFRESMASGSTGCFIGTPHYVPPESWDRAEPEPSWDIYATGVIAWEGLTGRLPYDAISPWQLISQLKDEPPPPLSELADHASPALVSVVEWMMHRDPAIRPHSAREVLDALKLVPEYVAEPETIASFRQPPSSNSKSSDSWGRRISKVFPAWHRRLAYAAGAGAMLSIGAGVALLWRPDPPALPTVSVLRPQVPFQRDIAAHALPNIEALLASFRHADPEVAVVYDVRTASDRDGRFLRVMLLEDSGLKQKRVYLHGEQSLWAGDLRLTDTPGDFDIEGTWLETAGLGSNGIIVGTWKGRLTLLAEEALALFHIEAVRERDSLRFEFSVAAERSAEVSDTLFVQGLEAKPAIAPLLFREGLPRRISAALWMDSLLPAWIESRGTFADIGDESFDLDGQLSEPFWEIEPGPLLARPLQTNASLAVAKSNTAMLIGVNLPADILPKRWEFRMHLAQADSPTAQIWKLLVSHDASSLLEVVGGQDIELDETVIRSLVGRASSEASIEFSIALAGNLASALQLALPWRCNAQIIDQEQKRTVLEWGAPDIDLLQHGAILSPLSRGDNE